MSGLDWVLAHASANPKKLRGISTVEDQTAEAVAETNKWREAVLRGQSHLLPVEETQLQRCQTLPTNLSCWSKASGQKVFRNNCRWKRSDGFSRVIVNKATGRKNCWGSVNLWVNGTKGQVWEGAGQRYGQLWGGWGSDSIATSNTTVPSSDGGCWRCRSCSSGGEREISEGIWFGRWTQNWWQHFTEMKQNQILSLNFN